MPARPVLLLAAAPLLVAPLVGCASKSGGGSSPIAVQAGKGTCTVAPAAVKATQVSVNVNWTGEGPGEVYLYAKDDAGAFTKVVGEVEDLTDGLTKTFTADVTPGAYEIACKTSATDPGTRRPLQVDAPTNT